MAVQYTYICDRCKKESTIGCYLGRVKIAKHTHVAFSTHGDRIWNRRDQEYELCIECRDELEKFMKGRKLEETLEEKLR